MIQKYYEEELQYLYESGKEFARVHPEQARFLDIDAVGDRDPYVERLFEGFAFLAARIREKLDDSFPELTGELIDLLWPQFLHEIPSLTIVQFRPRKGHLQETRILPRGANLLSKPVGPDSVPCHFMTTQEIAVNPVSIEKVIRGNDNSGRASLIFRFRLEPGVNWKNLKLDPIRIYLHAEHTSALSIHNFFLCHTEKVFLFSGNSRITLPKPVCSGFSPTQSLLPEDPREFRSSRLLLEYFLYPEKFMFIDLCGIDTLSTADPQNQEFSIELRFDSDFPQERHFGPETFRLFCTPAVNLYQSDTEPVLKTGKKTEYLVKPDLHHRHSRVHSIISVTALNRRTGETYPYSRRFSPHRGDRVFSSAFRSNFSSGRDLYISMNCRNTQDDLAEETLSVRAYCTDGELPRVELREDSINSPGRDLPDFVTFTNITRPTLPFLPPEEKNFLWIFLSQLSAGWSSFSSAEHLKNILSIHEWSQDEANLRKIKSISKVNIRPAEQVFRGGIIRGVEYCIHIQESLFPFPQEIHLFGEVLAEFLSKYICINSFLLLSIEFKPSGKCFKWNSLRGKKWPV